MKSYTVFSLVVLLIISSSALGLEKRQYQMRDDFGTEPLEEHCSLQYYYYVPCPTDAWFWSFSNWELGDVIGAWFQIGDQGTGGYSPCDPVNQKMLESFRVLDFAGLGTVYPGLFTVEFDAYCADSYGCPLLHLWNSGPRELGVAWNIIQPDPAVYFCPCDPSRLLITATMIGSDCTYPAWGFDNISTSVEMGCEQHDIGCLPALYPRGPAGPAVHSGYYGPGMGYCPPQWFADGLDTTIDGSLFGFLELAWRITITDVTVPYADVDIYDYIYNLCGECSGTSVTTGCSNCEVVYAEACDYSGTVDIPVDPPNAQNRWLRGGTDPGRIWTTSSNTCKEIYIQYHCSDGNDGVTDIYVDNMCSPLVRIDTYERCDWYVRISELLPIVHTVKIAASNITDMTDVTPSPHRTNPGSGDNDVWYICFCDGGPVETRPTTWGTIKSMYR